MNHNELRKRLQELLAVPERTRTDEQWDEIIELEIQTAKGNRAELAGTPMPTAQRNHPGTNPRRPQHANSKPFQKTQHSGPQQVKTEPSKGGEADKPAQKPRSQHPRGPRRPANKPPTPSTT